MQSRVAGVGSTCVYRNLAIFQTSGRISRKACLSTKTADTLPKLSRDYLATWLGSDMSGSSYHERMMNASKLPLKPAAQAMHAHSETKVLPSVEASPRAEVKARTEHMAMEDQRMTFPVISFVKWGTATATSIEQETAEALLSVDSGAACFLDLSMEDEGEKLTVERLSSLVAAAADAIKRSEHKISLLAAINCSDERMVSAANACGLQIIATPQTARIQHAAAQAPAVPPPVQAEMESVQPPASARIHYGAVRSGQQIYADGCSLVVIGSVNNGAEVMADGDIHVYGTLKGRAVAGLGGSAGAHIFARAFDASLIGVYDSFVAPDACAELQKLQGKEVFVRLLQKDEIIAELRACGAEVVDCGGGNSLVVSPL